MTQLEIRKNQLKNNFSAIKEKLPEQVCLVAVSKTKPFSDIALAYELGHRDFAENRVEELLEKAKKAVDHGLSAIKWHFVGNLQSNKISRLLSCPGLSYIHSVDREKILQLLKVKIDELNLNVKFFLQVNTSGEAEKSGFENEEQLKHCISLCADSGLQHLGLMTMSKYRTDDFAKDAKGCFEKLNVMKEKLDLELGTDLKLSMGMSNDYQIALTMGADFIRLGSVLFGSRV